MPDTPNPDVYDNYLDQTTQKFRSSFNNTITPYPVTKTIVDLFEEQVIKTPGNVAIRWRNEETSYRALNAQVNKLANYLIDAGVKNNDTIGVLVTRSPNLIIALLAILKAGATYVPIDPEYPVNRQEYIVTNSAIKIVLTNTENRLTTINDNIRVIQLGEKPDESFSAEDPNIEIDSHQLAYIIYTSGSTGNPKGVMIEHHSVVNLIKWVNTEFSIGGEDRLMFITSICFDLSVYDIFGILSSGGSVVIAEKEETMDLATLAVMLQSNKVTFWDSVPSTLDFLVRGLEANAIDYIQTDLRVVFLSGDWIPVNLPARIKKFFPNARVISLGGATEATVWSNFYAINKIEPSWKSIPYGKPIANNFFYILDHNLAPVPFGEQGELFIGGVGVARAYANDPEKTNYSFMPDPFNPDCGGQMYRTGDIGRMMPDGNMEFLGRKDQQVKIRGFRVELGEIESVAREYKFVDQAIVLAKDMNGLKRLIGYIVPKMGYDRDAMILFLKRKLPEYMVPGLWMELGKLPLNPNGKIDRNALPDVHEFQLVNDRLAPRNKAEAALADIWKRVLAINDVGMLDNFFDLGGQLLLAVQMLAEVEKQFKKKVSINSIFKYPTIELLAEFLASEKAKDRYKSLVPIKATGSKTPLYIIHGDGYNMSNFVSLANYLDEQQPLFSLQPVGLDGKDEPFDRIEDMAAHYVSEILHHNPNGPYAIVGYSFGGYVAIEIKRQLESMGKQIKMLGVFDTDAGVLQYKKSGLKKVPKKLIRQFPKALFVVKSLINTPYEAIHYQKELAAKKFKSFSSKFVKHDEALTDIDLNLYKINVNHEVALNNYTLKPFNGKLHLFKAQSRMYFVDELEFLGWKKFAKDEVIVYDIPGDHKTMFLPPHVKELASMLQNILND